MYALSQSPLVFATWRYACVVYAVIVLLSVCHTSEFYKDG